jgi:hypothetical protein
MLRNPLTSRVSFLLYGYAMAELLARFSATHWLVFLVGVAVVEWQLERRRS